MCVRRCSLHAIDREPRLIHPVAWPVSASRLENRAIEYLMSSVRLRVERSARTWAAECHVVPEVNLLRSTRMASEIPSLARWKSVEQPITPPPMTTTEAWPGSVVSITNSPFFGARDNYD